MSIYTINSSLNTTSKIEALNTMILELEGYYSQGKFNKNELDNLYDQLGLDRKYLRDQGVGNTSGTYTGWSHVHSETGYSIWKYSPTNYTYDENNNLYINGTVLENKGLASSETATTFEVIYSYYAETESGQQAYTDYTDEASEEGGSSFSPMEDTDYYLYLGLASKFGGAKFEFDTRGANYTLIVEYWNGAWTTLTAVTNDLVDNTSNLSGDGSITWTIPTDWNTATINTVSKYWIRIRTSTEPTTEVEINYLIPSSSVIGLLALGTSEIIKENWKWCTYGTSIYATIRNAGGTSYEGNYYITSASTSANKLNYFTYYNPFTADYADSTYTAYSETDITLNHLSDVDFQSGTPGDGALLYYEDTSAINAWRASTGLVWDNHAKILSINTPSPDASAILELTSTNKGLLLPRMTTAQRDSISSPAEGLVIYNLTSHAINYYNGSSWGAA